MHTYDFGDTADRICDKQKDLFMKMKKLVNDNREECEYEI